MKKIYNINKNQRIVQYYKHCYVPEQFRKIFWKFGLWVGFEGYNRDDDFNLLELIRSFSTYEEAEQFLRERGR